MSNLLAAGFKRFSVDLYWDAERAVWSLCPIEWTDSPKHFSDLSSVSSSLSVSLTASSSGEGQSLEARGVFPFGSLSVFVENLAGPLYGRQISLGTRVEDATNIATGLRPTTPTGDVIPSTSGLATTAGPWPSSLPLGSANGLQQIGPYACTSTIDISFLTWILDNYYSRTSDTLQAGLTYLILNIHAAKSKLSPEEPAKAPSPGTLPSSSDSIDAHLLQNLSEYLYTPSVLQTERANINESWYRVQSSHRPDSAYFDTFLSADNVIRTLNGWPSESYVEIEESRRLLVGFGRIDPQMQAYSSSGDASTVFASGAIESVRSVEDLSNSSKIANGCLLDPGADAPTSINSSWAVSTESNSQASGDLSRRSSSNITSELGACGISPLLNDTLSNKTADVDISPYHSFVASNIWSWAPGEPKISTSSNTRCALFNATAGGRWCVGDCSQPHLSACRSPQHPFSWQISKGRVPYKSGGTGCPSGSTFSAPRTALENSYLLLSAARVQAGRDKQLIWVNFNSLDVEGCWVSGTNAKCPYTEAEGDVQTRTVVIPTIAGIVVFVLVVLMLFVKCNANRRNSKRGKRRNQYGWIDEGVPS